MWVEISPSRYEKRFARWTCVCVNIFNPSQWMWTVLVPDIDFIQDQGFAVGLADAQKAADDALDAATEADYIASIDGLPFLTG